jgi:hypothetical protein
VPGNGPPLLRREVREYDPSLPTGEALLGERRAVRFDGELLGQRDPYVQCTAPLGAASGALASL